MKRNMMKTVEKVKGRIPDVYDMTLEEMQELHEILNNGTRDCEFDAFSAAFCYGFALGARAEKSGKYEIRV